MITYRKRAAGKQPSFLFMLPPGHDIGGAFLKLFKGTDFFFAEGGLHLCGKCLKIFIAGQILVQQVGQT